MGFPFIISPSCVWNPKFFPENHRSRGFDWAPDLWELKRRLGAGTLRCVWLQVAMKIKLMSLPQSTYCSERSANFNVMMIMIWWDDDDDDHHHHHHFMIMIMILIMTIVSVEQRPGWGQHVQCLTWYGFNGDIPKEKLFHPMLMMFMWLGLSHFVTLGNSFSMVREIG